MAKSHSRRGVGAAGHHHSTETPDGDHAVACGLPERR